nr:hypothetical protein GCM10020092_011970 [Actinoplanes digitatis]
MGGPWVDGGGWLTVDGAAVDWIYRDVSRVRQACEQAELGRYAFHAQAGHPLGVPDFAYAGEVALGVILADPSGELAALQERALVFPAGAGREPGRRPVGGRFPRRGGTQGGAARRLGLPGGLPVPAGGGVCARAARRGRALADQ